MLKVVCDKCGEEVPNALSQKLDYLGLATTDKWRVRLISNEIRDDYKGEDTASDEEKSAVLQFGHELIALATYQPVICAKCGGYSPEARREKFQLVKGGKNPEKE